MNKLRNLFFLILVVFFVSSCKITLPVKVTEIPIGPSVGLASCDCYLGFICPNAVISVNQAVQNGNLYKISTVDIQKEIKLFGLLTTYTTIVSGYSKAEWEYAFAPKQILPQIKEEKPVAKPEPQVKEEKSVAKTEPQVIKPNPEVKSEPNVKEKVVENFLESKSAVIQEKIRSEPVSKSTETVKKTEKVQDPIVEDVVQANPPKNVRPWVNEKEIDPLGAFPKLEVRGTSLSDLSHKLRDASEIKMISGEYLPIDINLDLKRFTFSCLLVKKKTNFIKLGLYFGPKSTGCESCDNIMIKNPGSQVLTDEISGNFIVQIIALKKN